MPELPEVERTRLSLAPLIGRTITRASLLRADICESFTLNGAPRRTTPADLLLKARVSSFSRRGKQLAIHTSDDRTLCIQLGMSGRLLLIPPNIPHRTSDIPQHTHAAWTLDDNSRLLFVDPRRFGGLSTYPSEHALLALRWSALGPDALAITADDLKAAGAGSHRPIKSLLLDQSALAGVGNIYADESLFRARIHPATNASALSKTQVTSLARAIRFILRRAIDAGGSTLRNYADSSGTPGRAQLLHTVYGRAGQPCFTCESSLASIRLAQRATVFCPSCQTTPPTPPAPSTPLARMKQP